jgi:hypothetical protein
MATYSSKVPISKMFSMYYQSVAGTFTNCGEIRTPDRYLLGAVSSCSLQLFEDGACFDKGVDQGAVSDTIIEEADCRTF